MKLKKATAILAVLVLLGTAAPACLAEEAESTLPASEAVRSSGSYEEYLSQYSEGAYGTQEVSAVPAADTTEVLGLAAVSAAPGAPAVFTVTVPESALYRIRLSYCIEDTGNREVDYAIRPDGAVAYEESDVLLLERSFVTEDDRSYKTDSEGNQYIPDLTAAPVWQETVVSDRSGYYESGLLWYLTAGSHSIELAAGSVPFSVSELTLIPASDGTPSYEEYRRMHGSENGKQSVVIEAEFPVRRSARAVSAFCDRSSAATSPAAGRLQVLNALGGTTWSEPGQGVTWKLAVRESGWYQINLKYRQDYTGGLFVSRSLQIDGAVPFREAAAVEFPYRSGWNNLSVSDSSGEPCLFWLESGSHTLTLTAVLGRTADVIRQVSDITDGLNVCYRRIILQTSANPDPYRDYQLDEKIPEVLGEMSALSDRLEEASAALTELMGGRGSENGILERVATQVRRLTQKPEKIPSGLSQFQSNISSLGTWVQERRDQSLELDSIAVLPPSEQPAAAGAGFFAGVRHSFMQFLYSFVSDYAVSDESTALEVWAATGRDQTAVIRNLIEEDFTAATDIRVEAKMVQAAALLPAVVAGIGPDAVLYADNAEPMNFASRGAVVDLTRFADFETVRARFASGAFNPYTYAGRVYALPEQQTFPVLFYRSDILEELSLSVPRTWDDVYGVITELSKNNMQFGIPSAIGGYGMLLYQNGGSLYTSDGKASAMDSPAALSAFRSWTKLFREYKVPVAYDFVNRFRSGEMPIAVQDYTAYNTIEVFAPEIKGKWSISTVPGTQNADGTWNYSVASGGTSCFILSDSAQPENAWKFLSWWTSADIQSKFGQRIEDKLGAAARYPTANLEASERLPWSNEFYAVLSEQWQWVVGTPEVPGGYFTGRHLNNAFRLVVYRSTDSTETMLEYVKLINEEIDEKQKELAGNLEAE